MGLQVELLEQSFDLVASKADDLVNTFYTTLFKDFPEVEPMFSDTNMIDQKKKLLTALMWIVANVRNPDELVPALEAMGKRHATFGVKEEHYPAVGQTLLYALATTAGDAWNDDFQNAWSEAFGEIAEIMIAGSLVSVVYMECYL